MNFKYKLLLTVAISTLGSAFATTADPASESQSTVTLDQSRPEQTQNSAEKKESENLPSLMKEQSVILKDLTSAVQKFAFAIAGLFGETAGTLANINHLAIKECQAKANRLINSFKDNGFVFVENPDRSYTITTNQSLENGKNAKNGTQYPDLPGKNELLKALS